MQENVVTQRRSLTVEVCRYPVLSTVSVNCAAAITVNAKPGEVSITKAQADRREAMKSDKINRATDGTIESPLDGSDVMWSALVQARFSTAIRKMTL